MTVSCRTGLLRGERSLRDACIFISLKLGPPVGRHMLTPTSGRTITDHLSRQGIQVTK
jgi:hypothetical protein